MKLSGKHYFLMFLIVVLFIAVCYNKSSIIEGFKGSCTGDKIKYGCWAANQNATTGLVPSGLSRVNVGNFQPNTDGIPQSAGAPGKTGKDTWMTENDFKKIKKDNPNAEVFVTLGGEGVTFSDTGTIDRLASNLVEFYNSGFQFDGLDFDMESDFRNIGFDKCVDIVSKVKSGIGKSLKTQFTVLAGMCPGKTIADGCQYQTSTDEVDWLKTNAGNYDYLGLMLYGSSMTSSGYGITCNDTGDASGATIDIIYKWITAMGSNKNKLILGMTATGNQNCYVEAFEKIVGVNCLSGISLWQAGTICAFVETSEALKKSGIKCSGSSGGGGADGKKCTSTNGKSGKCKQPGSVADCGSGGGDYSAPECAGYPCCWDGSAPGPAPAPGPDPPPTPTPAGDNCVSGSDGKCCLDPKWDKAYLPFCIPSQAGCTIQPASAYCKWIPNSNNALHTSNSVSNSAKQNKAKHPTQDGKDIPKGVPYHGHKKYHCVNDKCTLNIKGKYQSLSSCEENCGNTRKNTNKEIGKNGHRNNCPNNVSPVFSCTCPPH